MGNNGSTPLEDVTKDQVAQRVSELGDKFSSYAAAIDENGVDGDLLAGMNEEDFNETLDDLGVTSRLHRRKLLQEFRKSFGDGGSTVHSRSSTYSGSGAGSVASFEGSLDHGTVLPANGPVEEVTIRDIEFRESVYPYPDELSDGELRHSNALPTYNQGLASEDQMGHLAPDFWSKIDSVEGGYRPPIPEDDMERVAQVQSYGLEEIEPESDIAKTLTGYVEMATKLFTFDFVSLPRISWMLILFHFLIFLHYFPSHADLSLFSSSSGRHYIL
jgi:DNA-directed RNA polymerase subunit N (RpoN/RPB10)